MGFKKLFCWLLISILMLMTASGCMTPELNAIELVPENANLLVNIQASKIVDDQVLRYAYTETDKGPDLPQEVEEALDKVIEETGIDLRDISEAVIFADMTTMDVEEYLGIIVEGNFDKEQLIDNIEEKWEMDFTISEYRDYSLYIDRDEEFAITLLSEKMLLCGSTRAVKDSIDVSKGEKKRVSGIVLDTYNRFGDALIKVAFKVPEEARKTMAEEPITDDIPISMEPFADIDTVGFSLSKEIETVTVRIYSHFLSAESAEDAKDTISGAISLFKGVNQDRQVKELLGKIEVDITDLWVTINFEITLSEIKELMETFPP